MTGEGQELISRKITDLSQLNVVDFVEGCADVPTERIVQYLSSYIALLEKSMHKFDWEKIESIVHIINKGFRYMSEEAEALRYFYLGYYSHVQEELLATFSEYLIQDSIKNILQSKYVREILEFLFINDCSRQVQISKALNINKSNLSRKADAMVEAGLICKRVGPKCVLYELSSTGYETCKKYGIGKRRSMFGITLRAVIPVEKNDLKTLYYDTEAVPEVYREDFKTKEREVKSWGIKAQFDRIERPCAVLS